MLSSDRDTVLAMRRLLWPDDDGASDPGESVLVWEQDGSLGGFIIYSLRPSAEGCDGRPVPFVEGWFVREELRRRGIGRALIAAVEEIARARGFRELASDSVLTNRTSYLAHRKLGFEVTARLQCFRKNLDAAVDRVDLTIETFAGSRSELRPLFEQADDSRTAVDGYISRGDVLVARLGQRIVGHVQVIVSGADCEIKSIAVVESEQDRGVGTALVRAALERAFAGGATRVQVATATADIENLRFYQLLGFRMERIERDVFTAERGYPALEINGIPLLDLVWFSMNFDERRQ